MIALFDDLAELNPGRITVKDFRQYLQAILRSVDRDITVRILRDKLVPLKVDGTTTIIPSGMYDQVNDYEGFRCIDIFLSVHKDSNIIHLSTLGWFLFRVRVVDVVVHEMIHRHQARSRGFRKSKTIVKCKTARQEYLANEDEVEAYGWSLAVEEWTIGKANDRNTGVYYDYVQEFGANSKVVSELERYRNKYLNNMGDPYVR